MSILEWLRSLTISMLAITSNMRDYNKTLPDCTPQVVEKVVNTSNICLTPGCIHAASSILDRMNPRVEPCDDFYQFACGNFLENEIIPKNEKKVDTFSMVKNEVNEQLRAILEEESKPNEIKPFRLAKTLYRDCMNNSYSTDRQVLRRILKDLGGWPILMGNNWTDVNFNWKEFTYRSRQMGYFFKYFIDFSIEADYRNNTKYSILLRQPSFSLNQVLLSKGMENKEVQAYRDFMVHVIGTLGDLTNENLKELRQILKFETKLANITLPVLRNYNAEYNPMTVRQLQNKFPSINWLEYINTLLKPSSSVTEDEIVVVPMPNFITNLEKLLEDTPKRIQANYAMWRVINDVIKTGYGGDLGKELSWKQCVSIVSKAIDISVRSLYIRKHSSEDVKKRAFEMVSNIKQEYKKIVQTADWMDSATRRAALDKVDSMITHVAYPDELLDDSKLEQFYEKLELAPGSYLESVLNVSRFNNEKSINRLNKPVNKNDWTTRRTPAEINAGYSLHENSIQVAAALLQDPFFSHDKPWYTNYGVIGIFVGHEITRGFDIRGSQFDRDGNLNNWWEDESKDKFDQRAKCIEHQYSNYTVSEMKQNLDGVLTQEENIADNGGFKVAYLAYNEWVRRNKPEPSLPGLNYTPNQMFWISAANVLCTKQQAEKLELNMLTNEHSPGEFRVIGTLSNMPEFAKDFNCHVGSKMNPEKKCAIW